MAAGDERRSDRVACRTMDEKTVRLLDRVAEKVATRIADKIVNALATRLADQIAQRIVYLRVSVERERVDRTIVNAWIGRT